MKTAFHIPFAFLAALAFVAGCNSDPEAEKKEPAGEHAGEHEHEHGHEGPHGGAIVELGGGDYHGEVVHDDAEGRITVYVLDGDAKKNIAIDATQVTVSAVVGGSPRSFELPAAPDADDPPGKASRFELVDGSLVEALDDMAAKARLTLLIEGKPYSGAIEAHEH